MNISIFFNKLSHIVASSLVYEKKKRLCILVCVFTVPKLVLKKFVKKFELLNIKIKKDQYK